MHIEATGEPGDKHQKMYEVWLSCRAADIDVPNEVDKYFQWDTPNPNGLKVDIEEHECCTEINEDSCMGFDVDLRKLPEGITHIRFYNSY